MKSLIFSFFFHILLFSFIFFINSFNEPANKKKLNNEQNYISVSIKNINIKEEQKKINKILNEIPISENSNTENPEKKIQKNLEINSVKKEDNNILKKEISYNSYNEKLDNILKYYEKMNTKKIDLDNENSEKDKIKEQVKNTKEETKKEIKLKNIQKNIENINKKDNEKNENNIQNHFSKLNYIKTIRNKIYSNWKQKGNIGDTCYVEVYQNKFGSVINMDFTYCNNTKDFKNSVKKAIYLSSPFPLPKKDVDFQTKLSFTFIVE